MDFGSINPVVLIASLMVASTPILLAAMGELVVEKSGVLNLGVEGMMIVGAISGFIVAVETGSPALGFVAAAVCAAVLSALFGVLTQVFLSNQVATGLALTIFGVGISALVGAAFVGVALEPLPQLAIPGLTALPVIGPIVFGQDIMVYGSFGLIAAIYWFLKYSHWGLVVRAVGESHDSAHALGYPVIVIRYAATLFGGAMCGLGGAYLSLAYTPMWAENMTAGRGWIALALVVFATWRPGRLLLGAYMFGGITVLQLHVQAWNFTIIEVPSQFMSMLPYLATILVLVLISRDKVRIRLNAPSCIGKAFRPAH